MVFIRINDRQEKLRKRLHSIIQICLLLGLICECLQSREYWLSDTGRERMSDASGGDSSVKPPIISYIG